MPNRSNQSKYEASFSNSKVSQFHAISDLLEIYVIMHPSPIKMSPTTIFCIVSHLVSSICSMKFHKAKACNSGINKAKSFCPLR